MSETIKLYPLNLHRDARQSHLIKLGKEDTAGIILIGVSREVACFAACHTPDAEGRSPCG